MTTDLPTPSGTKRELGVAADHLDHRTPPPGRHAVAPRGSAAIGQPQRREPGHGDQCRSDAVRISVLLAMWRVPFLKSHFGVARRGDAEADHVDAACARPLCRRHRRFAGVIDHAAQRERQRAELARKREGLGLARREFQGRGLADHNLLAVLVLDGLIDGEHAHIGEDGFADEDVSTPVAFSASLSRRARMTSTWSPGRTKPPAPVSGRISIEIARMPLGRIAAMIAGAADLDQPAFLDRFAGRERVQRAIEPVRSVDRVRACRSCLMKCRAGGCRRPDLPLQIVLADQRVAGADVGIGDQDFDGFELATGAGAGGGSSPTAGEQWRQGRRRRPQLPALRDARLSYASLSDMTQTAGTERVLIGFHHPKVNSWLMRRMQTKLILD